MTCEICSWVNGHDLTQVALVVGVVLGVLGLPFVSRW